MPVKFSWTPGALENNLANAERKAVAYLSKTTAYYSLMAESRAKKGAKWKDRSTNARSGLTGVYDVGLGSGGTGTYSIELSHSVNYGLFLETRVFSRKGDLSIIKPTLDYVAPRFQKAAGDVLQRIFG